MKIDFSKYQKAKTSLIHVNVDPETYKQIRNVSKMTKVNISDVVREFLNYGIYVFSQQEMKPEYKDNLANVKIKGRPPMVREEDVRWD